MARLTPRERLAQLFMVAAYSNRDAKHMALLDSLVRVHSIGGLIWFQGGPVRQAQMSNALQARAKVPLMMAMDAEWGLGMRLDSTISYPRQMTLGALSDKSLIYRMGTEVAKHTRRLGMQMDFAPVVDVNVNAANPVIGTRSFGEEKKDVVARSLEYMRGLQDSRVLASAKHFPGHGDTETDSHLDLPVIRHDRARLDSVELYPFRELFRAGVKSVMVAHLSIPAIDTTTNLAGTLSTKVVQGLLRDEMGFKGLVFTDALNMKGVAKYYRPGEVEVKAFLAGNDVMLFAEDVPKALDSLLHAVDSGLVSQADIDARCRKVLMAKAWAGLDRYRPIDTKNLYEDLTTAEAKGLREEMISKSLTLLTNRDSIVPLRPAPADTLACVVMGGKEGNAFQEMLGRYWPTKDLIIPMDMKSEEVDTLLKRLERYRTVVIALEGTNSKRPQNYGITAMADSLMARICRSHPTVVATFGIPYLIGNLSCANYARALVAAYELNATTEGYAAQLIMGGIGAEGTLPVTVSDRWKRGTGLRTKATRIGYGTPYQRGMDAETLKGIDRIMDQAIADRAAPGAQILVVRDGMVVYERNMGTHMYDAKRPVRPTDLYDLASVTKVSATLPAFMQLVDQGKVKLDDQVSDHLQRLWATDKSEMTFREMLAHFARLKSWTPFYKNTLTDGYISRRYYRTMPSDSFPHQVAEDLYLRFDYPDTMRSIVDRSELLPTHEYKYSDLAYYYLREVVEKYARKQLDTVTMESFYRPMGLRSMGYLPLNRFDKDRIVPTEYDDYFRNQLVHGHVHDQGAAMLGGIGGHAGLFSHGRDLAALMQMYLNNGTYGGRRYVSDATMKEFVKCQYCAKGNRRGVGFDRPAQGGEGPTCECVSFASFGHTGFTGTMAWADPEQGIIYIFLSNRVYPDADNNKLVKQNVRTRIQQVIYDSIVKRR
jgi:beta-glucosidase-like glycosyl hydrolase/CubicO group peptidase (beta-lactamase class C family)